MDAWQQGAPPILMDFQLVRVTLTRPSGETHQAEGMVVALNPATGLHTALITTTKPPQAFHFTRQSIIAWQPRRVYREHLIDDHDFDKYEFLYN